MKHYQNGMRAARAAVGIPRQIITRFRRPSARPLKDYRDLKASIIAFVTSPGKQTGAYPPGLL